MNALRYKPAPRTRSAVRRSANRRRLSRTLAAGVVLTLGIGMADAFAAGTVVTSQHLTTSGAAAATYFGAADVGNSSCSVPNSAPFTCTTSGTASTVNLRPELILVDLVSSQANGTTLAASAVSGPFSNVAAVASVQYPNASDKNVLYAFTAQGTGSSGTITMTFSQKNGTANVEVIQLGNGNSVVTSSVSTGQGTTAASASTFPVTIAPSNPLDSEIVFLGTDQANKFSPTPATWTQLPGATAPTNWNSFSRPVATTSQTFTMTNTHKDWGSMALEISP